MRPLFSRILFDGFEGEEKLLPAGKLGLDGDFLLGEVLADRVQAAGVVLEKNVEGILIISAESFGEGATCI